VVSQFTLPGGISFVRSPKDWRIPIAKFIIWCKQNGYNNLKQPSTQVTETLEAKGKRDQQIDALLAEISNQDWNPIAIPRGGKGILKQILCEEQPRLFTHDGFLKAWQVALNREQVRAENHENYS
jgi:hypothetical protein